MKIRNSEEKIIAAIKSKNGNKLLLVFESTDSWSDVTRQELMIDCDNNLVTTHVDYSDFYVTDLIKSGIINGDSLTQQVDSLKEQLLGRDAKIKELQEDLHKVRIAPILQLHKKLEGTPQEALDTIRSGSLLNMSYMVNPTCTVDNVTDGLPEDPSDIF